MNTKSDKTSKNLEELVDLLSGLSVLDMADLKGQLEEKWGVKAAAAAPAVAAAPAAGEGAPEGGASESTEFQVTLTETSPDKKIPIIKVVREITGLGLKEAKDIVEAVPKVLKEAASKSETDEIKTKVEEAGGKVTIKGL